MRHVPDPKGGVGMESGVEAGWGRPDSLHVRTTALTLFSMLRLL